jgi:hypothetical protein
MQWWIDTKEALADDRPPQARAACLRLVAYPHLFHHTALYTIIRQSKILRQRTIYCFDNYTKEACLLAVRHRSRDSE